MAKNSFFSIFIFLTLLYLTYSSKFISLNLKYYKASDPLSSYPYTYVKIGTPDVNIPTYISTNNPLFSIKLAIGKSEDKDSAHYNTTCSTTFLSIEKFGYQVVTSREDEYAQESFIFNFYDNKTKKYNEEKLNNIDFALGVKSYTLNGEIYHLNIGFPVFRANTIRDKFNLILQLKEKNIIESYDWFILFDNGKATNENEILTLENIANLKTSLIMGGTPHFYDKTKFFKSQSLSSKTDETSWTIKFDEVYSYKTDGQKQDMSTYIGKAQINLDKIEVSLPRPYMIFIKNNFFTQYSEFCKLNNNIYSCDKSESFGLNELKKFPTLYLRHNEFDYTFELTYQDLFVEHDGKYYFLVKNTNANKFAIGFPLLKKYQFFFNQDSKSINFYNPNLPKIKEADDEKEDEKEEEKEKEKEKENEKAKEGEKEKGKDNDFHQDKNSTNNETKNDESGSMSIKKVVIIVVVCGLAFIAIGFTTGYLLFRKCNKNIKVNELHDNCETWE